MEINDKQKNINKETKDKIYEIIDIHSYIKNSIMQCFEDIAFLQKQNRTNKYCDELFTCDYMKKFCNYQNIKNKIVTPVFYFTNDDTRVQDYELMIKKDKNYYCNLDEYNEVLKMVLKDLDMQDDKKMKFVAILSTEQLDIVENLSNNDNDEYNLEKMNNLYLASLGYINQELKLLEEVIVVGKTIKKLQEFYNCYKENSGNKNFVNRLQIVQNNEIYGDFKVNIVKVPRRDFSIFDNMEEEQGFEI